MLIWQQLTNIFRAAPILDFTNMNSQVPIPIHGNTSQCVVIIICQMIIENAGIGLIPIQYQNQYSPTKFGQDGS